jgi:hypothetical protein
LHAETLAKEAVLLEWHVGLFATHTGVEEPKLAIEEAQQVGGRFRSSGGGGFTFYTFDAEESYT